MGAAPGAAATRLPQRGALPERPCREQGDAVCARPGLETPSGGRLSPPFPGPELVQRVGLQGVLTGQSYLIFLCLFSHV